MSIQCLYFRFYKSYTAHGYNLIDQQSFFLSINYKQPIKDVYTIFVKLNLTGFKNLSGLAKILEIIKFPLIKKMTSFYKRIA